MPRKFDFLSPGIEIREVDQSILPSNVDADGPIIIGRFRKGPGMKPTKVRSLDYFIDVYGNPVPGGSSIKGDIWRDGPQLSAPTYGAYAAQAWLASRTSPVNLVRLLGDQHPQATDAGKAGWQVSGSEGAHPLSSAGTNSTAYGLFIVDKDSVPSFGIVGEFEATGIITDGVQVTVNDGVKTVVFEADDDSSVSGTNIAFSIVSGNMPKTMENLATAIQGQIDAGNLNVIIDYRSVAPLFIKIYTRETVNGEIKVDGSTITPSSSAPTTLSAGSGIAGEGTLAAVFYCNEGYLALSGSDYAGTANKQGSGVLIRTNSDGIGLQLKVYDKTSSLKETINFNFDRTSGNYIRSKLNTNPQLVNSDVTETADLKTYWLGESFERSLKEKVTGSVAGDQLGILFPLHKNDKSSDEEGNWGYQRTGSAEAKSGWIIGRNYDSVDANYIGETSVDKLFRFECIHAGEEVQKNVLITIEDLKKATNESIYPYGTFSVKVINLDGGTLEHYSGLNLDPNSPNFIARRIGDMYMEWDENDRRYRSYGNNPNVSDYIRVKMYREEPNYRKTDLPVGFLGPGRPKGFTNSPLDFGAPSEIRNLKGGMSMFTGSFIRPGVDAGSYGGAHGKVLADDANANLRVSFPKLPLRINGSDGYSANPYKVHFGVRPKIDANSSLNDPDFCDYLRPLPAEYRRQLHNPSGDFEYSFVFSLEDLVVSETNNTVTWTSGSHKNGTAYTSTGGDNKDIGELFDLGVKQFALPLFGGFDGLDITEKEPFRQALIGETLDEKNNYLQYSINKAIDSVMDPEAVPASLLAAPGIKNAIITSKIIRGAETRKDVLAVVDLKGDYTPSFESKESQKKRLGSVTKAISELKARQINSSYACAYYPAVQITDNLNNGERVWVPSSVAGIGAMAQSDAASELWFAPAGFNRGGLGALGGSSGPRVIQARQRLDSSERDRLYEVNINPIATFPNEGVVIFGQKTLQQTPSALDRINVRRLMIYLKAEISKVARNVLFDNNVRSTWARFRSQAEPILETVQSKFGLTEYRLILDSSTTTADLIDRNIMYAKVFLKPARAIEFIAIDFVITRTGAEFN